MKQFPEVLPRSAIHRLRRPSASIALSACLLAASLSASAAEPVGSGLGRPYGIAMDASGNLYVADTWASVIRKISPSGDIGILAGAIGETGSADGRAGSARFFAPAGIAVDASGNLFVADTGNDTIREITPAGEVTTIAGAAGEAGSVDGYKERARFSDPFGVTLDRHGNLFVADSGNNTVRKIAPTGVVSTVAGAPGLAGSNDGPAIDARFSHPYGIAMTSDGAILVADTYNHTIRSISANGMVTTLAGTAGRKGKADGYAGHARFFAPSDLVVAKDGSVYVTDLGNAVVRHILGSGSVTTLTAATVERFPMSIAKDAAGNLFISEPLQSAILRIDANGLSQPVSSSGAIDDQTLRVTQHQATLQRSNGS